MKNFRYIPLVLMFMITSVYGQQELTLFHMNNIVQSSYINPTAIPEFQLSIGLPGISSVYGSVWNSPFRANDLKQKVGDSVEFTVDKALSKMSKNKNYFRSDAAVDLFSLRFKVRNLYFTLNATEKVNMRFTYPKDFISLLVKGNAQFIGAEGNFDGIALNAMHYREYGFGITRHKQGAKWTYGGRVKVLFGMEDISFSQSKAKLSVNGDYYQNKLDAQLTVNTTSMFNPDAADYDTSYTDADVQDYYTFNTDNMGLAMDAGVTYELNKKLSFTGALNNLGYIKWNSFTTNYKVDGEYEFAGISVTEIGKDSVDADDFLDSLEKSFEPTKSNNAYTTRLAPQVFLSAQYKLGRNTQLSGTLYTEFYKGVRPAVSVAISQRAGRILNLIASYSVFKNSYNNLGFGFMFKPGPFQLYVVGDNMLALANPFNANYFNVRAGMNLVFVKARKPEAPSHNE